MIKSSDCGINITEAVGGEISYGNSYLLPVSLDVPGLCNIILGALHLAIEPCTENPRRLRSRRYPCY